MFGFRVGLWTRFEFDWRGDRGPGGPVVQVSLRGGFDQLGLMDMGDLLELSKGLSEIGAKNF